MLQRRQLLLDDKVTLDLIQMAREEGRSVSDLAREMLAEKIKEKQKKFKPKKNAAKMMLEIAKRAQRENWTGPTDLSTNDDYIY